MDKTMTDTDVHNTLRQLGEALALAYRARERAENALSTAIANRAQRSVEVGEATKALAAHIEEYRHVI